MSPLAPLPPDEDLRGALIAALAFLAFVVVLAFLGGGCAVHVTVVHQLRSPIRCKMDHRKNDLGFLCDHIVKRMSRHVRVEVGRRPGEGVPPL